MLNPNNKTRTITYIDSSIGMIKVGTYLRVQQDVQDPLPAIVIEILSDKSFRVDYLYKIPMGKNGKVTLYTVRDRKEILTYKMEMDILQGNIVKKGSRIYHHLG